MSKAAVTTDQCPCNCHQGWQQDPEETPCICEHCRDGSITPERIQEAAERAEEAFWSELAAQFPEISTGDYNGNFSEHAQRAAEDWVHANLPADNQ